MAEKDKFELKGQYSSESGSVIRLNATSIPQGSVKVTAGGVPLTENTDYIVDYNMGTVTIINSALIESQTPIQVSLGEQSVLWIPDKNACRHSSRLPGIG
jgi:cell surface protein SprA